MTSDIPEWTASLLESETDGEDLTGGQQLTDGFNSKTALAFTESKAYLARKRRLGRDDVQSIDLPFSPLDQDLRKATCIECGGSFQLADDSEHDAFICSGCTPALETWIGRLDDELRQSSCPSCGQEFTFFNHDGVDAVHCLSCGDEVPLGPVAEPEPETTTTTERVLEEPYTHGDYTLHERTTELNGGGTQTIYFFAKSEPKSGRPVRFPSGYELGVNDRTGLPYLRKGDGGPPEDAWTTMEVEAEVGTGTPTTTTEVPDQPPELEEIAGEVPVERIHGVGDEYGDVLRDHGVDTLEAFLTNGNQALADAASVDVDLVREWRRLGGLRDVRGIGEVYSWKLLRADVTNIEQLLEADPEPLAEEIDVAASRITRWQTLGGLLDVEGVGPRLARRLIDAGVTTDEELADADAAWLAEHVGRIGEDKARTLVTAAMEATA